MPLTNNPTLDTGTPPRRRWKHIAAAAGIGALTITALVAAPASASHPEVSLPGSDFEIDTNANLKVDDPAPSIDWASVTQVRKARTLPRQRGRLVRPGLEGGHRRSDGRRRQHPAQQERPAELRTVPRGSGGR